MYIWLVSNISVEIEEIGRTPEDYSLVDYDSYAEWYYIGVAMFDTGAALVAPLVYSAYEFQGWYTYPSDSAHLADDRLSRATTLLGSSSTLSYSTIENNAKRIYAGRLLVAAKYKLRDILVILNPMGGELSGTYFVRVYFGQPYGTLPDPTRDGYTFDGWYTAPIAGTRITPQTPVDNPDDHTLYAHWTAVSVQHTLYFNANGGTVSKTSRQVYSGSAYGSLPTPTWNYHTFAGWFTDPYSGTRVDANTIMGNDDVIIYAHWTDNTTTVTFNGNGGKPSTQTITYPSGSKYGSLPSATRNGYILTGWFTAATGGVRVEPSDTVSAQILYAHWQTSGGTAEGVVWNKDTDFVIEMPAQ